MSIVTDVRNIVRARFEIYIESTEEVVQTNLSRANVTELCSLLNEESMFSDGTYYVWRLQK